jgi:ubiquinone/menaquinone biosynthesis C-methylase UbiE
MIDKELEKEMLLYYNERAKEHDEVYRGEGPAIKQYSKQYIRDVAKISEMALGFGNEHLIDIACGTGFWAPHYAGNCSRITFLDQSEGVLSECKSRVDSLGLAVPRQFVRGNLFDIELKASAYDCALVGFLLSHFIEEQEETFFRRLDTILKSSAGLMVIESIWNEQRQKYRRKEGIEKRALNDGRTFRVYKKYFERSEIVSMLERRSFSVKEIYEGGMLIAVIAKRANHVTENS